MKQRRQEIGQKIGIGALISTLCGTAHAGVSAELMLGNQSSTLDTKYSGELAPKTIFYGRNRTTTTYDNTVSTFFVGDVAYTLLGGLDALVEVQAAPAMGVVPRIGMEYFTQHKNVTFFGELSGKVAATPNAELTLRLTYKPALGKNLSGFGQLETISDVGFTGHEWSTERLRLGFGGGGYTFGAAVDLTQVGKSIITTPSYGAFIGKKF